MNLQTLSFVFGALLLLVGIIGGGFEIKELKMPKVPMPIRLIAALCGAIFIFFAFKYGQTANTAPEQQVKEEVVPPGEKAPAPKKKVKPGKMAQKPNPVAPGVPGPPAQSDKYMQDTNLLWGDIAILVGENAPSDCERACNSNDKCLAWTWVRQDALPLIPRQNLAPFCALKNSTSLQTVHDTCCVSGYRQ